MIITSGKLLDPTHPGEVLREEFLDPLEMTAYGLARDISVPDTRIYNIVEERRAITADTALRLARYFGTTPRFWLNLQAQYDLETEEDRTGETIEKEVKPRSESKQTVLQE